jgi:preprotein translocase SecE subunit
MASSTKQDEETMADDERDEQEEREDREERSERQPLDYRPTGAKQPAGAEAGFFHIYKSGQGYWTRMCSAGGAALIILATAAFFFQYLPSWSVYLRKHEAVLMGILVGLVVVMGVLSFWLMNKPRNVDFLIATDSEMKKVNWTSREELIGSTKIVILFVVIITAFLFVIDLIFGYFFYGIKVLETKPF